MAPVRRVSAQSPDLGIVAIFECGDLSTAVGTQRLVVAPWKVGPQCAERS